MISRARAPMATIGLICGLAALGFTNAVWPSLWRAAVGEPPASTMSLDIIMAVVSGLVTMLLMVVLLRRWDQHPAVSELRDTVALLSNLSQRALPEVLLMREEIQRLIEIHETPVDAWHATAVRSREITAGLQDDMRLVRLGMYLDGVLPRRKFESDEEWAQQLPVENLDRGLLRSLSRT